MASITHTKWKNAVKARINVPFCASRFCKASVGKDAVASSCDSRFVTLFLDRNLAIAFFFPFYLDFVSWFINHPEIWYSTPPAFNIRSSISSSSISDTSSCLWLSLLINSAVQCWYTSQSISIKIIITSSSYCFISYSVLLGNACNPSPTKSDLVLIIFTSKLAARASLFS